MSRAIAIARHYSMEIHNDRSLVDALGSVERETAELRTEVENGSKGVDGIKGEAIDVFNSTLDVLFLAHPEITMEEIDAIMEAKCRKWMLKYAKEDDQTCTETMREADDIMSELKAGGLTIEEIAEVANIEQNSVECVLDGSLASRRTKARLNAIFPVLNKAFGGKFRSMKTIWMKEGPDGVTFHELLSTKVVDLTKLGSFVAAHAADEESRRDEAFETVSGAELNAADGP
ncbi:hypothetical protein [Rhizobium sp. BK176]|uniref:hypothetical protein n=1 Tax=Rhizobium sp. BK176 TaxID=2587071 RepID=UPI002169EB98|nr:hypothetical protein [Rhizobium sp. BK176]MCS4089404.1 hypothetical protein [Rhizobium sp. BK176]